MVLGTVEIPFPLKTSHARSPLRLGDCTFGSIRIWRCFGGRADRARSACGTARPSWRRSRLHRPPRRCARRPGWAGLASPCAGSSSLTVAPVPHDVPVNACLPARPSLPPSLRPAPPPPHTHTCLPDYTSCRLTRKTRWLHACSAGCTQTSEVQASGHVTLCYSSMMAWLLA